MRRVDNLPAKHALHQSTTFSSRNIQSFSTQQSRMERQGTCCPLRHATDRQVLSEKLMSLT